MRKDEQIDAPRGNPIQNAPDAKARAGFLLPDFEKVTIRAGWSAHGGAVAVLVLAKGEGTPDHVTVEVDATKDVVLGPWLAQEAPPQADRRAGIEERVVGSDEFCLSDVVTMLAPA